MSATPACPRCGAIIPAERLGVCPSCLLGAPGAADDDALLDGTYALLDEIGHGAAGTVYRAHDRKLDRTVAIKILHEDLGRDAAFRARFDREARALARLVHPNVVVVHDVGQDEDLAYLVLELGTGGSLDRRLPPPVEAALDVAVQICRALSFAHERGVVHRDVKPANVLVDGDPDGALHVRVADFGIARLVGPDATEPTLTRTGVVAGTPAYVAPEALAGAAPDPRMDVYSVGVVLYESITGRLPLGDFDSLPGELDRVVRRALAPDPDRRYATAAELGAALAGLRGQDVSTAIPPGERAWMGAVASVLALGTALGLWAFLESVRPKTHAPGAALPLTFLDPRPRDDGSVVTLARFELWPTLAALLGIAAGLFAVGALRGHWVRRALDRRAPERPVPSARVVLGLGVVALGLWCLRHTLEAAGADWIVPYTPFIAGIVLLAAVVAGWYAILDAWRTSRSLTREPGLWIGAALVLVFPIIELVVQLRRALP